VFGLRRRKLPRELAPPLERDERVVAWARTRGGAADGGVAVATDRGLWLPRPGGPERLGWHEIHKAGWAPPTLTVVPAGVVADADGYVVVADLPARSYQLDDPDQLPHQVRTRVTRSVSYTRHHPLPSGGVRVASRRVPGVDGVRWTVRYDPGTAYDSAAVRDLTAQLVEEGRAGGASEGAADLD